MSSTVTVVNHVDIFDTAEKLKIGLSSSACFAALQAHGHETMQETHYSMSYEYCMEEVHENIHSLIEARRSGDRTEVKELLERNAGLRQIAKVAKAEDGIANLCILW